MIANNPENLGTVASLPPCEYLASWCQHPGFTDQPEKFLMISEALVNSPLIRSHLFQRAPTDWKCRTTCVLILSLRRAVVEPVAGVGTPDPTGIRDCPSLRRRRRRSMKISQQKEKVAPEKTTNHLFTVHNRGIALVLETNSYQIL